jgi:hypothetical protein
MSPTDHVVGGDFVRAGELGVFARNGRMVQKGSCRARDSREASSNKHTGVVVLYCAVSKERGRRGCRRTTCLVFGDFAWRARRALSLLPAAACIKPADRKTDPWAARRDRFPDQLPFASWDSAHVKDGNASARFKCRRLTPASCD